MKWSRIQSGDSEVVLHGQIRKLGKKRSRTEVSIRLKQGTRDGIQDDTRERENLVVKRWLSREIYTWICLEPNTKVDKRKQNKIDISLWKVTSVTHLVILGVGLQQAVLLDGHRGRQRDSVSSFLSFFFAAALHSRRGRLGQRSTAQPFIAHALKERTTILS